jgi:predicted Zn-dependent peptidase
MHERNSAAVAVWVRTGGRFESKKISGVSHFLEHMLFKGTKRRNTRQIKEEIEGVGGVLNAFTGEEITCFFAKLLSQHFPKALDVLSDMVNHAALDPVEIRKERAVILEEIKMYRDLPAHYVHDLMGEVLWPNQPLGRPLAGTDESVSRLTRRQILEYKERYYHPKNVLVVVAGPIQHHEVVARVKDHFPQRSRHPLSQFTAAISRQSRPGALYVEKQMEQTNFVIGLHGFSRKHPDRYKLGLLNIILGANMSSRLFEEVREKRGLAYEIKSGLTFYEDTGSVTVSAGVESKKTPTAIVVILRELAKVRKRGVSEDELRRAKDYFMSQLYMALEDTLDHALWIGEKVMYSNELPDREEIQRGIEKVTQREIQEIARHLFRTKNLNLTLIGPIPDKIQARIKRDFELAGT